MTAERTSFVYVSYIASTPEKVFEAITRPEITRRYWGHENVSDWTPGARWQHVRDDDARSVDLVGKVVEVTPPNRLVITWTGASQEAEPDSYSRVTFEIEPDAYGVRLCVTHDDLIVGSQMEAGVSKGWPLVLSSLKSCLETGKGFDLSGRAKAA
ncbi:SRPBCC family protein [Puniceibacterium confluentis]|uniref:SRPBCC family protein n=1 Tax=Puniceibacterium confluentis TaxID=1958944 RepID=UPI0011B84EB9|nr:SRPBCC family protein [Puniceibacterium confluentis]